MTIAEVHSASNDIVEAHSSSNPVLRVLRSWLASYVAAHETHFVGTTQVDVSARLNRIPIA